MLETYHSGPEPSKYREKKRRELMNEIAVRGAPLGHLNVHCCDGGVYVVFVTDLPPQPAVGCCDGGVYVMFVTDLPPQPAVGCCDGGVCNVRDRSSTTTSCWLL